MSIDLNWEALTGGPDGEALAHSIRDFIHTKFQSVPLPRFIKSVTVHDFEFGTTPPELELKDITDPLPDFYEENSAADDEDSEEDDEDDEGRPPPPTMMAPGARLSAIPPHITTSFPGGHMRGMSSVPQDLGSPFLGTSTPGILGGASNLSYFHSHLAGGLSGTQTPLAAVAGAQLGNNGNNHHHYHHYLHQQQQQQQSWQQHVPADTAGGSYSPLSVSTAAFPDQAARNASVDGRAPSHSRNPSQSSISVADFNHGSGAMAGLTPMHSLSHPALREKSSVSTFAPTSSAGTSRPPTRDNANNNTNTSSSPAALAGGSAIAEDEDDNGQNQHREKPRFREARTEDIQAVFRINYSGDVRLLLTADILLDYPMPSFVGIPLRLSITGLSFDGVGVVAHIRKRVHFCFLSPEDALAAVGADENGNAQAGDDATTTTPTTTGGPGAASSSGGGGGGRNGHGKMGGLLQEIRVESEIGQREGGKQSLKNVGKVERFVLEQVRRIFEEEFVYPSFWTFLV
ncbi:hypothetical protein M406DRAFT_259384 [Cryphonectria parasitica EP155]|uniref:Mitochondrial distribution and morphology protein 12 n=1 Tax=Cryphonectria parasitica (strain ATCC 38755 / EP155) TaxID=660469 RepID=A0A9P4Y0I0_CRYP1|nr:uncharacterized protein M406DRAFT_259384 [Cryphonectria parasitica EP155]KAF3764737.1 hypothetical protein M406DRAFT_259384 [Cryphonectria parasitica EP155]